MKTAALIDGHEVMAPPPWPLLLREVRGMALFRSFSGERPAGVPPKGADGKGAPVLVLPGFMAADSTTDHLRAVLRRGNYRPYGWGQGRNTGITPDLFDRLDRRMEAIAAKCGNAPVSLVGWSLGGLVAREYAKARPERVAKVVTLASPFSGDLRANHVWRIYELIARHRIDAPPMKVDLAEKPPVPTYAIWSRHDGLVAGACCRGRKGERDVAIEVGCGHIEMVFGTEATDAVFRALKG